MTSTALSSIAIPVRVPHFRAATVTPGREYHAKKCIAEQQINVTWNSGGTGGLQFAIGEAHLNR